MLFSKTNLIDGSLISITNIVDPVSGSVFISNIQILQTKLCYIQDTKVCNGITIENA